jgi:hypothetical protein
MAPNRKSSLMPESRAVLDALKRDVKRDKAASDEDSKMTARQAGSIGGETSGPMVKRLVAIAEQQLAKSKTPNGLPNKGMRP